MTEHSKVISGSTATLRLLCNGSRVTCAQVPDNDWNVYAATGTALHSIIEIAIQRDLTVDEIKALFVGTVIEDVEITEEMIDAKIAPAIEFFDDVIPQTAEVMLEHKIALKDKVEGAFGISDVIFLRGTYNTCGIIDWKFGDYTIVRAEDNDQMRFYLAGSILSGLLPVLPDNQPYVAYIFQPSTRLQAHDYVSKGVYTYTELMEFVQRCVESVEMPVSYNVGPHCKDCKGKIACSAFQQSIGLDMASDIKGLSLSQLRRIYEIVPAIKKFIAEIDTTVKRNAAEGRNMPGYGTETALGNSVYADEASASGALGRLGLGMKDRTVTKVISPTQAQKKLKELQLPADKIKGFVKRHVVRPETGLKVVKLPDDVVDSRAAFRNAYSNQVED